MKDNTGNPHPYHFSLHLVNENHSNKTAGSVYDLQAYQNSGTVSLRLLLTTHPYSSTEALSLDPVLASKSHLNIPSLSLKKEILPHLV